jgi:hypothetical protein
MNDLKKSVRIILSRLLLLCFTVAILPIDFYHNHSLEQTACNESAENGTCKHKLHLSQKSTSCWACAVHFDKTYLNAPFSEKITSISAVTLYFESKVTLYFVKLIFTDLRGPPVQ